MTYGEKQKNVKQKILLLDIETAPNTAYVWGLFRENINIARLIESSYTLCWAAKWVGDDHVYYASRHTHGHDNMVELIHEMLDEADAVIHYNGTKFDIPTLNKEFLLMGLPPPSPFKQIDLLKVARNRFRFPSNKLEYVAKALGLGAKTKGLSYSTWEGCMNGDKKSWKLMEEYNIQDVLLLESVYDRFLPWIKSHLNLSLYTGDVCCPNCGSGNYQRRGYHRTQCGVYQRFQCNSCGNWFKAGGTEAAKIDKRAVNIS